MNHPEAAATGAVERYLLGQMDEAEESGFERHYFECIECAEEIRLSTMFLENLRAVLREPQPIRKAVTVRQRFFLPLTAAAAVALATFSGYQNLYQIPQLRQAAAFVNESPATFYLAQTRSAGDGVQELAVRPGARYVSLILNRAPGDNHPYYDWELRDDAGNKVRSARFLAPPDRSEWQIPLQASNLRPGTYTLMIRGAADATSPADTPAGEFKFRLSIAREANE